MFAYFPVRLGLYAFIAVVGGIVVLINKGRAAVKQVNTQQFIPELTSISRQYSTSMPNATSVISSAVGGIDGAAVVSVTSAVFVSLRQANGLFVRITPTQPLGGGTKLVIDAQRKVKMEKLTVADDAFRVFESSLQRRLRAAGYELGAPSAPSTPAAAAPPVVAPTVAAPNFALPPVALPPVAAPNFGAPQFAAHRVVASLATPGMLPAPSTGAVLIQPIPALANSCVLVFDTGQCVPLTSTIVIGRDPIRVDKIPNAGLVVLADPELSVSKTHLAVGPEPGGAWIEDLSSANGTVVVDASGVELLAPPGKRAVVHIGSVVRFGDRWLQIKAPEGA
jgi:FHA domain